MNAAENDPGTLLKKVAVDLFAAQQGDAMLPGRPFGLGDVQILGETVGFDLQGALGFEPAATTLGLMHEITDDERRDRPEDGGDDDGADAATNDHGRREDRANRVKKAFPRAEIVSGTP